MSILRPGSIEVFTPHIREGLALLPGVLYVVYEAIRQHGHIHERLPYSSGAIMGTVLYGALRIGDKLDETATRETRGQLAIIMGFIAGSVCGVATAGATNGRFWQAALEGGISGLFAAKNAAAIGPTEEDYASHRSGGLDDATVARLTPEAFSDEESSPD